MNSASSVGREGQSALRTMSSNWPASNRPDLLPPDQRPSDGARVMIPTLAIKHGRRCPARGRKRFRSVRLIKPRRRWPRHRRLHGLMPSPDLRLLRQCRRPRLYPLLGPNQASVLVPVSSRTTSSGTSSRQGLSRTRYMATTTCRAYGSARRARMIYGTRWAEVCGPRKLARRIWRWTKRRSTSEHLSSVAPYLEKNRAEWNSSAAQAGRRPARHVLFDRAYPSPTPRAR